MTVGCKYSAHQRVGKVCDLSSSVIETRVDRDSPDFKKNTRTMLDLLSSSKREELKPREGGGARAIEAQHKKGRLTARERVALLLDPHTELFEQGIFAAYGMYKEWGGAPSAGVVTGLGRVAGRLTMIIANDATVKRRRVFPDDGEESAARAAHRHGQPAAHDLSGGFSWRIFATAGGRVS